MNYSPIDLSANLNCRAVTLKYKRNYNLWLENMNFTTTLFMGSYVFLEIQLLGKAIVDYV